MFLKSHFLGCIFPFFSSFFFPVLKKVCVYLSLHNPLCHALYFSRLCLSDYSVYARCCGHFNHVSFLNLIFSWFLFFLPDFPFICNRLAPLVCMLNSLPKIHIKHALLQEAFSIITLGVTAIRAALHAVSYSIYYDVAGLMFIVYCHLWTSVNFLEGGNLFY